MSWSKVKEVVATTAPVLGSLLGGPVGGSVGVLISQALGVDNNADAILNELTLNPEAKLKLKELTLTHKVKLEELTIRQMELRLKDVDSARNRQIQSEKATGKKDINLYMLAWIIVGGFFFIVWFLMNGDVPDDKTGVLYMLLGTLATAFMQVIHYMFGSSSGSKEKSMQIDNLKRTL